MKTIVRRFLLLSTLAAGTAGCALRPSPGGALAPSPYAGARLAVARQFEKLGMAQQAAEVYQSIAADAPQWAEPLHRLAVLSDRLGQTEQAEQYYQQALSLDSENANLLNDLGYSYYLQHRFKDAEETLLLALQHDPKDARALNNLGVVLGRQGRLEESLAIFRQVVSEAEAQANLAYVSQQYHATESGQDAPTPLAQTGNAAAPQVAARAPSVAGHSPAADVEPVLASGTTGADDVEEVENDGELAPPSETEWHGVAAAETGAQQPGEDAGEVVSQSDTGCHLQNAGTPTEGGRGEVVSDSATEWHEPEIAGVAWVVCPSKAVVEEPKGVASVEPHSAESVGIATVGVWTESGAPSPSGWKASRAANVDNVAKPLDRLGMR